MDRRQAIVRRTTWPIWGMVVVAVVTSGAAIGIQASSLRRVGTVSEAITTVDHAAKEVDLAFGRFTAATTAEARSLLRRSDPPLPEAPASTIVDDPVAALDLLAETLDDASRAELAPDGEGTRQAVEDARRRVAEAGAWQSAWRAVEARRLAASSHFQSLATGLRNTVAQAEGRRRLDVARGREPAAALDRSGLYDISTELLDLGIQVRELGDATSTDALTDIDLNRVRPSLGRLHDVVAASGFEERLGQTVADLRTTLVGAEAGDLRPSPESLVGTIEERLRLRGQGAAIDAEVDATRRRLDQVREATRGLVDRHVEALHGRLEASIASALWRSALAAGLGLATLGALAIALSRQAARRTVELVDTVEELQQSRAKLVDLRTLRDALARLEETNHQLTLQREVVDQAGAVCEADENGIITYVNDLCCALSGFEREELVGSEQRLLLASQYPVEYWKHILRALESDGIWKGVLCGQSKGGTAFWVQSTIMEIRDRHGSKRRVAINADISSQVAAEQTLEEQAASLAEARARAEDANIAKSAFLAAMSHEIRTPLNGVLGALELLSEGALTEQQQRYIQISQTSAESLMSIIDDILDFSKIEAGRLELCPSRFDLQTLIESVGGMLSMKAVSRGLELVVDVAPHLPRWLFGDAERLRQVLINLINNAIKFTERGTVSVKVECGPPPTDERAPVTVRVDVTDTGIGIPPDRIHLLFRSFSQTDASMSRRYGGSGLGLAICKKLVEMMGGTIGVRSEVGAGSTFWFQVPLERTTETAAPSEERSAPAKGLAVLVVDDNAMVRETIARYCQAWRMRCETVDSVAAAIELCERRASEGDPFSAVLCDQTMGELDAFDLAAIVRGRTLLRGLPLVLMTPAIDMNVELVRAAGFAVHISKPVRQSDVLDAILGAALPADARPAATVAQRGQGPTALPPPPAGRRWRVLLAEDNQINQLIAQEMLQSVGVELSIADDGLQAVEQATSGAFDLIIMDCQMPGMDGFDATRTIRAHEAERSAAEGTVIRVPIVALTANALSGDRERCIESGMDAYCSKPIVLADLVETASRLLAPRIASLPKAA